MKGEGVEVSREAIATLAAQAACQVPGVVSCYRSPVDSLASRVKREFVHKGIKVENVEGAYRLGVHLRVEYGVNLPSLAREVRNKVREYLEGLTDVKVEEVEVIIEDIEPPAT
ncbi:Asp23/Gls24 family envelope stress response protein [Candidatus Solincola tengchongensis]|uniref:Asp23/Gls24 family envelope stress response protein n=1 Tax=Candidatus Solincola tengchongensis TaxID=2900693 RepID=UPI00257BD175|nr:Asp23/Gls24 family envelope stress response protein [Candidatus Solincola tengchongensis]